MSADAYTEKMLPVSELEIDRRIQRDGINMAKVEHIKRHWNPAAAGFLTVSHRKDRSYVILDGQHRWEAWRQLSDNTGTFACRVFERLTLVEEAQMFLDLNYTTQPRLIEKFRVRLEAEDPVAVGIDKILRSYEWKVSHIPSNGHVNAVAALERLYQLSEKRELEPNLVQQLILVITRAWGHDRYGVQAMLLEGIGRLLSEHGSKVDFDILISRLREIDGGPQTLHTDASQYARLRKGKVSMAVAELVTNAYNKGRRVNVLPEWRQRS